MAGATKKSVIPKILVSLDVVGEYIFICISVSYQKLEITLVGGFRRLTSFQLLNSYCLLCSSVCNCLSLPLGWSCVSCWCMYDTVHGVWLGHQCCQMLMYCCWLCYFSMLIFRFSAS